MHDIKYSIAIMPAVFSSLRFSEQNDAKKKKRQERQMTNIDRNGRLECEKKNVTITITFIFFFCIK